MTRVDIATTFSKGLSVLEAFEDGAQGLTMAEVARRARLDKASARRLCLTLMDRGYLRQEGRRLSLTARCLAAGAGYLAAQEVPRGVQPVLEHFAGELDSEIALAVLDGKRAIYVARSASPGTRISLGLSVGSSLPLHPTAIGRMLLAQLPPLERAQCLGATQLKSYTFATEVDPETILAAVAAAAEAGFCHLENAFEMGAGALAVPCGDLGGAPAALGTTGTVDMLRSEAYRARARDILRRAALSLGLRRGAG